MPPVPVPMMNRHNFTVLAARARDLAQEAQLLTLAEELSAGVAGVVSGKLKLLAGCGEQSPT